MIANQVGRALGGKLSGGRLRRLVPPHAFWAERLRNEAWGSKVRAPGMRRLNPAFPASGEFGCLLLSTLSHCVMGR
jgi:hypothetical protein